MPYDPYRFYNPYPASSTTVPMQQSFAQPQCQPKGMEWVEGEVGAKAFQMPIGWPANTPIPLWDSTEPIIYLKSWAQMGMPNPLQRIRYTVEPPESQNQMSMLTQGQSGATPQPQQDMSNYVTRAELDQLRQEMKNNQNGVSNSSGFQNNRGGKNG